MLDTNEERAKEKERERARERQVRNTNTQVNANAREERTLHETKFLMGPRVRLLVLGCLSCSSSTTTSSTAQCFAIASLLGDVGGQNVAAAAAGSGGASSWCVLVVGAECYLCIMHT